MSPAFVTSSATDAVTALAIESSASASLIVMELTSIAAVTDTV